jgi:beta-phosphoglucomutase-like phosphatase (HAD superfamily)
MEMKTHPVVLEKLYILDFDRTLVDSTWLAQLLLNAVDEIGYDSSLLRESLEKEKGNSFQLLRAAREVVGSVNMAVLKEIFMKSSHDVCRREYEQGGFFEPGAHDIIETLPRGEWMIFTYGDDEQWQTWKLEAAGLGDEQYVIATERDETGAPVPKSELLTRMRGGDGVFTIQNVQKDGRQIRARSLTMVDDKPSNLLNLPEGVVGHLYYPERIEGAQTQDTRDEYMAFLNENRERVTRLKALRDIL